MGSSNNIPNWVKRLLEESFFNPCQIHENSKRNEENMYCLECCFSFCRNCIPSHDSHCYLQIYKNNRCDSAQIEDLKVLTDCDSIQVYKCNSQHVVYLNSRKTSHSHGSGNNQCCCGYAVMDPNLYCSLSCKVTSQCAAASAASSSEEEKRHRRKGIPHRSPLF